MFPSFLKAFISKITGVLHITFSSFFCPFLNKVFLDWSIDRIAGDALRVEPSKKASRWDFNEEGVSERFNVNVGRKNDEFLTLREFRSLENVVFPAALELCCPNHVSRYFPGCSSVEELEHFRRRSRFRMEFFAVLFIMNREDIRIDGLIYNLLRMWRLFTLYCRGSLSLSTLESQIWDLRLVNCHIIIYPRAGRGGYRGLAPGW